MVSSGQKGYRGNLNPGEFDCLFRGPTRDPSTRGKGTGGRKSKGGATARAPGGQKLWNLTEIKEGPWECKGGLVAEIRPKGGGKDVGEGTEVQSMGGDKALLADAPMQQRKGD